MAQVASWHVESRQSCGKNVIIEAELVFRQCCGFCGLREFIGWIALPMSARALIKRGVAIANEVHGNSRSEKAGRPVASPASAPGSRTDALISDRAVLALEDM